MPPIIQRLTSISPYSPRSGTPPSRRLLALMLCAMLVFGSILPGFAAAGEADTEGEGTTPPIEVPVEPPDFDPGGEETGLEEEGPDSGTEEEGAGVEAEVEIEVPAPETAAPTEAPAEVAAPPPPPSVPAPEPATSTAPESESESQKSAGSSETVMNQSITTPKQQRGDGSSGTASVTVEEVESPPPAEEEAPSHSPAPVAAPPAEPGRDLGGKGTYVVRPGDCLWHIAAAVLPSGSDTRAVEDKVEELWRLNEDRIGTGDPNLIYPGIVLRLR